MSDHKAHKRCDEPGCFSRAIASFNGLDWCDDHLDKRVEYAEEQKHPKQTYREIRESVNRMIERMKEKQRP